MPYPGNRGKSLEKAIKKLFESYASRGIHCQQNFPEKLFDGTIVNRHGFDFQIFYQGKFFAFDAKECALNRWPLDKAKLHQLKALLDIERQGGDAFFLVHFTALKKLIKFYAHTVQESMINGNSSLTPQEGEATTINILEIK